LSPVSFTVDSIDNVGKRQYSLFKVNAR
jgi:hypothetical protein